MTETEKLIEMVRQTQWGCSEKVAAALAAMRAEYLAIERPSEAPAAPAETWHPDPEKCPRRAQVNGQSRCGCVRADLPPKPLPAETGEEEEKSPGAKVLVDESEPRDAEDEEIDGLINGCCGWSMEDTKRLAILDYDGLIGAWRADRRKIRESAEARLAAATRELETARGRLAEAEDLFRSMATSPAGLWLERARAFLSPAAPAALAVGARVRVKDCNSVDARLHGREGKVVDRRDHLTRPIEIRIDGDVFTRVFSADELEPLPPAVQP